MSDAWYYADNGEQVGPYSIKRLREFLMSASGGNMRLVWRQGFREWRRAEEVEELADLFESPPPVSKAKAAPPPVRSTPVDGEDRKTQGWKGRIASIGAALIGILLARLLGGTFWVPALLIGISGFVLTKCKVASVAVPMLALVIGHTLWLLIGHSIVYATSGQANLEVAIDIVAVAALTTWFFFSNSRAAAIAILVYQVLALGGGLLTMGDTLIPDASRQALHVSNQTLQLAQVMHIVLRLAGIGACIYAIAYLRKFRETQHV